MIVLDAASWGGAVLSLVLSLVGMSAGRLAMLLRMGIEENFDARLPAGMMMAEAALVGICWLARLREEWKVKRRERVTVVRSEYSDDVPVSSQGEEGEQYTLADLS